MTTGSDGAFFEFGTNAPEVARLVASALNEIKTLYGSTGAALAAPRDSHTFLDDLVVRIKAQVAEANAAIAQLGNVRVSGGADARRGIYSDVTQQIQRTLYEAQQKAPPSLRTFDFGQLGRLAASDVEQNLRSGAYSNTSIKSALSSFESDLQVLDKTRDEAQRAIVERLRSSFAKTNPAALSVAQRQQLTAALNPTQAAQLREGASLSQIAPGVSASRLTSLADQGVIKPYSSSESERLLRQEVAATNRIEAERLATLRAQEAAYAKQVLQAEKLAAIQSRGPVQGFTTGFLSHSFGGDSQIGSGGAALANLAQTAGSALRYSVAYGSIFAISQGLRDIAHEALDFTDSFTDMKVAVGGFSDQERAAAIVNDDFINNLSDLSRFAGANVGAALDSAARGVRAFVPDFDTAPADQIASVADSIVRSSQQISLIAGQDLQDATGDVIAVAQSFGLAAEQAQLVVDAISTAKQFGGAPSEIESGLAGIASTAAEAGFNIQETANLISSVTALTDQTGVAVATRFSRIFSILGGTTGQSLLDKLAPLFASQSIDPGDNLHDQLFAIAKVYNSSNNEALQASIRSSLGGTANNRELTAFFKSAQRIEQVQLRAGAGAQEWARKSNDLVGTLRKLQGSINNIETGLVRSGLFAPVGILLKGLELGLNVIDQFLQAYNSLLGGVPYLQDLLAILVEIALASKVIGAVRATGVLGSGGLSFFGGKRIAAENALAADIAAVGERRVAAETAVTTEITAAGEILAASLTRTAGAAAVGGAVRDATLLVPGAAPRPGVSPGLIYPPGYIPPEPIPSKTGFFGGSGFASLLSTLKITGLITAGFAAFDQVNRIGESSSAIKSFEGSTHQQLSSINGDTDLQQLSDSLKTNAKTLEEASGGFGSFLADFLTGDARAAAAGQAEKFSTFLNDQNERIQQEQRYGEAIRATSVFGDPAARGIEELNAGLEELASSGTGSLRTFRLLAKASLEPPRSQVPVPGREELTQNFLDAFLAAPDVALKKAAGTDQLLTNKRFVGGYGVPDGEAGQVNFADVIAASTAPGGVLDVDPEKMRAEFQRQLDKHGVEPGEFLDRKTLRAITGNVLDKLGLNFDDFAERNKIRDQLIRAIIGGTEGLAPRQDIQPSKLLADTQITERATSAEPKLTAAIEAQTNVDDKIKVAEEGLKFYDDLAKKALDGTTPGQLIEIRARVVSQTADLISQQFEQDRKNIVAAASSRREARQKTRQAAAKTIQRLVELGKGSETQVIALMEATGKLGSQIAIEALRQVVQDAKAAVDAAILTDRAAKTASAIASRELGRAISILPDSSKAQAELQQARANLNSAQSDYKSAATGGSSLIDDYDNYHKSATDATDAAQNAADKFAAQANAVAAEQGTALAQAQADLKIAQYNLDHAKVGSTAYYEALAALYQAQDALAAEERARAAAQESAVAARKGGSLEEAKASIDSARADLNAAAEGSREYFEALTAYYQAQDSLSQAILDYARTKASLRIDTTDPVAQARVELRLAERKLKRDIEAGKGKQVRQEDKAAVNDADNSLAQTKFDEFVSDLQTQEQLGQITFTQYIKYLESERKRLQQIKNKTHQEQDQLNQINSLLKEASQSLEGQFNLGDIKLPTVYQARRYMEEQLKRLKDPLDPTGHRGDGTGPFGGSNNVPRGAGSGYGNGGIGHQVAQIINSNNTTLHLGTHLDRREIRKILAEILGEPITSGTSSKKK